MVFRFRNVDEIIKERIVDNVDLVIEGGIGKGYSSGFYLYRKFRSNGYNGYRTPYVGVDLLERPATVPEGLRYVEKTDALNTSAMNAITEEYKSESPIFVTNCCGGVFFESSSKIDQLVRGTYDVVYVMQMHRQFGGFDPKMLEHLIKASKEFGWKTSLQSREVVLMELL
jgi:hypothetical protein